MRKFIDPVKIRAYFFPPKKKLVNPYAKDWQEFEALLNYIPVGSTFQFLDIKFIVMAHHYISIHQGRHPCLVCYYKSGKGDLKIERFYYSDVQIIKSWVFGSTND